MDVYTYSEARRNLAALLDKAKSSGKVLIRRKDGQTFSLTPEDMPRSPLDVPTIKARIRTDELVALVREGRERPNQSAKARAKRR